MIIYMKYSLMIKIVTSLFKFTITYLVMIALYLKVSTKHH